MIFGKMYVMRNFQLCYEEIMYQNFTSNFTLDAQEYCTAINLNNSTVFKDLHWSGDLCGTLL